MGILDLLYAGFFDSDSRFPEERGVIDVDYIDLSDEIEGDSDLRLPVISETNE